jgi:hypothetical protein
MDEKDLIKDTSEIDYFEMLNRKIELNRLEKDWFLAKHRNTFEGRVEEAIIWFRVWCRCLGFNPYKKTNDLIKIYLDTSNEDFKHDSRFLFIESEDNPKETVIKNKKILLKKLSN